MHKVLSVSKSNKQRLILFHNCLMDFAIFIFVGLKKQSKAVIGHNNSCFMPISRFRNFHFAKFNEKAAIKHLFNCFLSVKTTETDRLFAIFSAFSGLFVAFITGFNRKARIFLVLH